MFTMGAPLRGGSAAASGLTLPYTMTFTYASKALMLADYIAQGFTMEARLDGAQTVANVLLLSTSYGDDSGSSLEPFDSVVPGVKSAYLFGNAIGVSYPYRYIIGLPAGTAAKRVTIDLWKASAESLFLEVTYSNASVSNFEVVSGMADFPFDRVTDFPSSPPSGAVYIVSVAIYFAGPSGSRWAIDNLTFTG